MKNFIYQKNQLSNKKIWLVARALISPNGELYKRAQNQAKEKSLYTMNASQAGNARSPEMKYQRQLMGCLAEIYVQEYLKEFLLLNGLDTKWTVVRYDDVRTDGFKNSANEYDIKINKNDRTKSLLVESRSSITRDRSLSSGIEDFDIIGPYESVAKGGEKYNDIYVRPLYEYKIFFNKDYSDLNFESLLKKGLIELYIVAGCLKEDMILKGYFKNMMQGSTNYRVVKILDGSDAESFYKKLLTKIS